MEWHSHPNCSEFGGPGEDGQNLALSAKVLGRSMTCRQANTIPIYYFATCPDWVNGGKKLMNSNGTQVFPNVHMPAELKNLPPGAELRFRYKGREAVGVFLDVGPASWTKRYLDLGYPLARYLGFNGTGTVEWALVEKEEEPVSKGQRYDEYLDRAVANPDAEDEYVWGAAGEKDRDHDGYPEADCSGGRHAALVYAGVSDSRTTADGYMRRAHKIDKPTQRGDFGVLKNPNGAAHHIVNWSATKPGTVVEWKGKAYGVVRSSLANLKSRGVVWYRQDSINAQLVIPKKEAPVPKTALLGVELGIDTEMGSMIASAKARDNAFFVGAVPVGNEAAHDVHRLAQILVAYCTNPAVKTAIDKLV